MANYLLAPFRILLTVCALVVYFGTTISAAASATVEIQRVDPVQSKVTFRYGNGSVEVSGELKKFDGTIEWQKLGDLSTAHIQLKGDLSRTRVQTEVLGYTSPMIEDGTKLVVQRDPIATFESRKIHALPGTRQYQVEGTVTRSGVTHPITLNVQVLSAESSKGILRMEISGPLNVLDSDIQLPFASNSTATLSATLVFLKKSTS